MLFLLSLFLFVHFLRNREPDNRECGNYVCTGGPEDLSGERTNFLRSKRSLLVDKLHLAYLGDFLVLGRLPDE